MSYRFWEDTTDRRAAAHLLNLGWSIRFVKYFKDEGENSVKEDAYSVSDALTRQAAWDSECRMSEHNERIIEAERQKNLLLDKDRQDRLIFKPSSYLAIPTKKKKAYKDVGEEIDSIELPSIDED